MEVWRFVQDSLAVVLLTAIFKMRYIMCLIRL